ncbi:MAG: hypothetical protein IPK20_19825 [Betaproteobacteria bacterium]|nr:hypothetical protein [Betaproteobacteria bacterium]
MLGYYGQPDMTAEAIDREGYLKTGDIISRLPWAANLYPRPVEGA